MYYEDPCERGTSVKRLSVCIVPFPEMSGLDRYSLGGAYIATALDFEVRKKGLPIDIHYLNDLDHCLHSPETIARQILNLDPDIVGLGLFVWSDYVARKVALLLKEAKKDILVVGGGPWVSGDLVALAREYDAFDCLIAGDAEFSFSEVVERFFESRTIESLKGIAGTIVRENDSVTITPRKVIDPNLVPNPYGGPLVNPIENVRIIVRRGCGMKCKYCNWGGGFSKALSEENIRFSMEYAGSRGVPIWIVDSAINRRKHDLSTLASVSQGLERKGLQVLMGGFIDYEMVDTKTCDLMRQSSFIYSEIGLQTINPQALAQNNRKFDRGVFERAVSMLRGIAEVVVDIMLGLPGDNPEGFVKTVDYLKSLGVRVHLFYFLGVTSSEYFMNKEKYGLVFDPIYHYLVSSPTFSEKDLSSCASYYVENYPWKGNGSDFSTWNPGFARRPYNYMVPYESYAVAHERFKEPLPPPQLGPGSKILDVGTVVRQMLNSTRETNIDGFIVAIGGYSYDSCRLEIRESDGRVVGSVTVLKKDSPRGDRFLVAGKNIGVTCWTIDHRYQPSVNRIAEAVGDALMQWEEKQESRTL